MWGNCRFALKDTLINNLEATPLCESGTVKHCSTVLREKKKSGLFVWLPMAVAQLGPSLSLILSLSPRLPPSLFVPGIKMTCRGLSLLLLGAEFAGLL